MPGHRGQKVDILGHFGKTVFSFGFFSFAAPKLRKGGSQNNVQPLVSP